MRKLKAVSDLPSVNPKREKNQKTHVFITRMFFDLICNISPIKLTIF